MAVWSKVLPLMLADFHLRGPALVAAWPKALPLMLAVTHHCPNSNPVRHDMAEQVTKNNKKKILVLKCQL